MRNIFWVALFIAIAFWVGVTFLGDVFDEKNKPASESQASEFSTTTELSKVEVKEIETRKRWPETEDPESILKKEFFTTFDTPEDLREFDVKEELKNTIPNPHTNKGLSWYLLKGGFVEEGGVQKYRALFGLKLPEGERSHVAGVLVGGGSLALKSGFWELETVTKFITSGGSNAYIAEPTLVKIGPEKTAFVFEQGYNGLGGYFGMFVRMISLVDGSFIEILNIQKSEDNGASSESQKYFYDSRLEYVPGANPEYFDIKITKTGTEPGSSQVSETGDFAREIKPVNEASIYRFVSGKYVKQ